MHTLIHKLNTNNYASVANKVMQKKTKTSNAFQFADNRASVPVQRKLQNAMYHHQQTRSAQKNTTVQRVLRNPEDAPREARLIQRYHASEERGDNTRDHAAAIGHYDRAIQARTQVNGLHTEVDQGHLDAIGVLQGKIRNRRNAIAAAAGPGAGARARARRRNRAAAAAAPAPAAARNLTMGTADQASFLPGNPSAWHR